MVQRNCFKKDRPNITPENAVEFLESLEWYVYGGSFLKVQVNSDKEN
ncbi:hypothetical protein [Chryseobacterium sp. CH1]|nr:hypothetical protein [Chryseobacterium sp. CH1]